MADLRADAAAAGLQALAVLPWHDRAKAAEVSPDVLAEVRRTYPAVTVEDLLATFIAFVAVA